MKVLKIEDNRAVQESPTMTLRFLKRGGRFILQQCWMIAEWTEPDTRPAVFAKPLNYTEREEWRDVPAVVSPDEV
jgi:hypothetical protein